MAKVLVPERSFPARLRKALAEGLKLAGIAATIRTEPVPKTKLHRVLVVAPNFKHLNHSERQDLVWRIMDDFPRNEQMQISMISTLTPDEIAGRD